MAHDDFAKRGLTFPARAGPVMTSDPTRHAATTAPARSLFIVGRYTPKLMASMVTNRRNRDLVVGLSQVVVELGEETLEVEWLGQVVARTGVTETPDLLM